MTQIFLFFSDPDSHPKFCEELVHVCLMTPFYQLLFLLIILGSCTFLGVFRCSGCFPMCPLGGGVVRSSLVTATPAAHRHQRAYLRQLQLLTSVGSLFWFSDTLLWSPPAKILDSLAVIYIHFFFLRWSAFCFHRSSNHGVLFERPSRTREINLTNK